VFLSLWNGTEVYVVDGSEVLRLRSLSLRAVRQFEVGAAERHVVQVKLDGLPSWKCLIAPDWIAEVYVDGQLMIADLFPVQRQQFREIFRVLTVVLVASVGALLLAVFVLAILLLLFGRLL
jgi:hypothetical protein